MTEQKVALGRRLFFDRRLSADGSLACASCHRPNRAFSDPRPVSIGVFGRMGQRNAPAIVNRGYGRAFFWDGRTTTLEDQVLKPSEPTEMGSDPETAAARVGLTRDELARALSSYVRTILAGDSPFDRYVAGDRRALSAEQELGLKVFRGKGNCTACHIGPTFSDEAFHNTGVAFRDGVLADIGRAGVTGNQRDRGAFKTPTLREVARTGPFMHDGSLLALEDVVEFYDRGGNPNAELDPLMRPLRLTAAEKRALGAFLRSLSGRVTEGARTLALQSSWYALSPPKRASHVPDPCVTAQASEFLKARHDRRGQWAGYSVSSIAHGHMVGHVTRRWVLHRCSSAIHTRSTAGRTSAVGCEVSETAGVVPSRHIVDRHTPKRVDRTRHFLSFYDRPRLWPSDGTACDSWRHIDRFDCRPTLVAGLADGAVRARLNSDVSTPRQPSPARR